MTKQGLVAWWFQSRASTTEDQVRIPEEATKAMEEGEGISYLQKASTGAVRMRGMLGHWGKKTMLS